LAAHNEVYIVQTGDTLTSIARKKGMSVPQLTSLNGIRGDLIKPGQKLLLNK
jgi:D-gamma-glutamyl-meso-diaminopimelic acid endopeptidase CwlS/peptidoglycan endopeptidase LytF/peptidoglycan endopeptidase LytE